MPTGDYPYNGGAWWGVIPPDYYPQHPCPSCGHCPTCGRGKQYTQPPFYGNITGNVSTLANGQFQPSSVHKMTDSEKLAMQTLLDHMSNPQESK